MGSEKKGDEQWTVLLPIVGMSFALTFDLVGTLSESALLIWIGWALLGIAAILAIGSMAVRLTRLWRPDVGDLRSEWTPSERPFAWADSSCWRRLGLRASAPSSSSFDRQYLSLRACPGRMAVF